MIPPSFFHTIHMIALVVFVALIFISWTQRHLHYMISSPSELSLTNQMFAIVLISKAWPDIIGALVIGYIIYCAFPKLKSLFNYYAG